MKIERLHYFLILCFVAILLIKVNGVVSWFFPSVVDVELAASNNDAKEKDEKKIDTEYFAENLLRFAQSTTIDKASKKMVFPENYNKLNYFPEILTPPPLV